MLMAQVGDDQRPSTYAPPMSSWSAEVEVLTSILDAVREAGILAANAQGAKIQPPKPAPRPRTAFERVRAFAGMEKHNALVARLNKLREEGAPTMADVAEAAIEVHHPPHGKVERQGGVEREES